MSKGLSNEHKRELANTLMYWLKQNYNYGSPLYPLWENISAMLDRASESLHEHKYDLWQVHDLLRALGRIELNCPNGRKGGHLANDTPVELPLMTERKCDPHRCPIVTAVLKTFPDLYDSK
jgi:hypothetical protein